MITCEQCGKILISDKALRSHMWLSHTNKGRKHKLQIAFKKDRKSWNKGLTKEFDKRVLKNSKSLKIYYQTHHGSFFGKTHSVEARKKLSKKLSVNNKGGRCKWYTYKDIKVQGTWELIYAIYLDLKQISWIKIASSSRTNHTFKWLLDGIVHHYTPDFYLVLDEQYIDLKGYWWGNDKLKIKLVKEQNDINLKIIEDDEFKDIQGFVLDIYGSVANVVKALV